MTICALAFGAARASAINPCDSCGPGDTTGSTRITVGITSGGSGTTTGGSVTGDSGAIDCGSDCTGASHSWDCPGSGDPCTFSTVDLTAHPNAGWTVDHWSGCDDALGSNCHEDACCTFSREVDAFFKDIAGPAVALTGAAPSSPRNSGFTLHATDSDNDKVASAQFYVRPNGTGTRTADGPAITNPSATLAHSFDVSGLPDGTYFFGLRAIDASGNVSDVDEQVVIDKTVAAPVIDSPAGGSWHNSTSVAMTWHGVDSDVSDAHVQCEVDTGSFGACASRTSFSPTLTDGTHTLTVQVTDNAGNVASSGVTVHVDTAAPTLTFTGGTAEGAATNAPSFDFSADGTGSSASETCAVDSATPVDCSGGTFSPSGLSEGQHTLHVHVSDEAGNTADFTRGFTVDTTPPSAAITGGPADGALIDSTAATFQFNAEGGSTVDCSLDSATTFRSCSGTAEDALSGLSDGAHTWRVRARDAAGNTTTLARSFTVDTVPPDLTVTGGPPEGSTLYASSATFGFTAEAGSTVACALDSATSFHACTSQTTDEVSGLTPGSHTWRVRATDAAGNVATRSRTFTARPPAPTTQKVKAGVSTSWSVKHGRTKVRKLRLTNLPPGASVRVSCSGKGCPFKARSFTAKNGVLDLTRKFGKRLRSGAAITIVITAPGMTGEQISFTTRSHGKPRRSVRALTAG